MSKKYMFCIILLFVIALSAVSAINPIGAVSPDDVNSTNYLSLSENNSLNSNFNSNFNSYSICSLSEERSDSLKSAENLNALKDNLVVGGGGK